MCSQQQRVGWSCDGGFRLGDEQLRKMAHSLSFPYQASLAPNPAPHHQVSQHILLCENLQNKLWKRSNFLTNHFAVTSLLSAYSRKYSKMLSPKTKSNQKWGGSAVWRLIKSNDLSGCDISGYPPICNPSSMLWSGIVEEVTSLLYTRLICPPHNDL